MRYVSHWKKCAGVVVAVALSAFGLSAASGPPAFEVASVKRNLTPESSGARLVNRPNGIRYTGQTLRQLLCVAYEVRRDQVVGPGWLDDEFFDVLANSPKVTSGDQIKLMLQSLLIERFSISMHLERRNQSVYILKEFGTGIKLKPLPEADSSVRSRVGFSSAGDLEAMTLPALANLLARFMDRPVSDGTGLTGIYDIKLHVAKEDLPGLRPRAARRTDGTGQHSYDGAASAPVPTVFAALKSLGLNLEKQTALIEYVVLESISRIPVGN
jgi:uncharacterized protein (TIGR03435 family)